MSDFPPIELLLPHRPPAIWIHSIVKMNVAEAEAEVILPILPADERWPMALSIELMAQCAALCRDTKAPPSSVASGMLIRATKLRFLATALPQNTPIRVTAKRESEMDARLQHFKGVIQLHETLLAEGAFALFSEAV